MRRRTGTVIRKGRPVYCGERLFAGLGTAAVTLTLCAALLGGGTPPKRTDEAVAVMAAVRDELVMPEKPASALSKPERSVFDELGEFFARLILGE